MTQQEQIVEMIAELRAEADEARHLTLHVNDSDSIADLFKYTAALEADANYLELELRRISEAA